MRTLLVVYPGTGGATDRLAEAVLRGARTIDDVSVVEKLALDATAEDVLAADGLLLGTPEKFGYMAGLMKDFLERVFYPCEGRLEARPYAVFVSAGNDGSGATNSIDRIVTGLRLKKVHDGVIVKGEPDDVALARCEELGATVAAGIAFGMF
jgi:multimeric flavodoxin WrbA